MKRMRNFCLMAALFSASLPFVGNAQLTTDKLYFRGGAGPNWFQSTDLKSFLGPVDPGSKMTFDTGFRASFAAGYDVTDWFAPELDLGWAWSNIRSVTGATEVDASFGAVPLMVNARLQLPGKCPLKPYIGAGLGGSIMYIDADELDVQGGSIWGTGSAAVFAWQGFAGVRYQITDRVSINAEYRYLWTDEPDFESEWHSHEVLKLGKVEAHSVILAVEVRL